MLRMRLWISGVLCLFLIMATAFAARTTDKRGVRPQTQDRHAQRTQGAIESRHNVPVADGRRNDREIRSSSRSVSILDNSDSRPSLRTSAAASPGFAICGNPGTSYDYQHNDLGQKQIATLGGDPNTTNVHFTWTHWDVIPESLDRVDRFFQYNGFNPTSGLCLGDCGVTFSGAGGDPNLARAGFGNIDLMSDDNAMLAVHQRNEAQQPLGANGIYSSFVLDQGIPCFNLFQDNELNGSLGAEAIWPHGTVDRGGGVKAPGDDVFHVTAHPSGKISAFTNEIHYWRRVGISGAWQGPVVLDINAGPLNHYVTADPASERVAVIYTQDQTPGDPDQLLQVVYMESFSNGADWIADGAGSYPTPLTSLGHSFQQVTNYTDPYGPQSWLEAGGEYDLDGNLHIFWVEQDMANVSSDCRLRHWSNSTGFSTVAQAIGWDNHGGDGGRDLWLAYPGIAFGDGQTNCSDGPANPGTGGANSNRNYVYYIYEQYGGETAVEQADASSTLSKGGTQMNLEFYLSASNDGGATWSPPTNLTNTKTPGCDGTPGNECASERDPSMARVVNDAIHIQYILDIGAGDAVFGQGDWTFNPVMYYKIPGGDDNKIPNGVCPVIAPSFAARLTSQDPDCEYHATYSPAGQQVEDLIVENFGVATMTGSISFDYATWLTVAPSGAYNISPGGNQTSTVTMNAGSGSIQSGGEGLYQTVIHITHNDPTRVPLDIPIDFFVFNEFYCPEYVTLKTGVNSDRVLYLAVSNVENFANQSGLGEGLARMNETTGDSSYSIYDGTLLIAVPPSPDTLVYRNTFGEGNGQPGFRALGNLIIDTSAYGTNAGYASAFANQSTIDSTIGVDVEYIFPQAYDSAEFVLIKYTIFNLTGSDINDLVVGNAVDFDVTPGPDSLARVQPHTDFGDALGFVESGPQNTGHLRSDYNLVYQQGVDSVGHSIVGDVTATRFKGGITSIQCFQAPRAWIAPSDPWLFSRPGSGFTEGYLYQEMTKSGYELFPPNDPDPEEDLHTVMVHEQGIDLTPTTVKRYLVGLVSSNIGTSEDDIINTTRKAWKYAFGWQNFVASDMVAEDTPASYPYYAVGSHEDGLNGGCYGCEVMKVWGAPELTIVPGPDPCEGMIEFAGGDKCGAPYQASFRVTDLCHDYWDEIQVSIDVDGICDCVCPFQSDYDEDGCITVHDLCRLIDVLFLGPPEIQDPFCPISRGDFNCDAFPDALDLGVLIDHLFFGGNGPCNPCGDRRVSYSPLPTGRFHIDSVAWSAGPSKRAAAVAEENAAAAMFPSVVVESKTVRTNDCFSVGVFLENDTPIRGLVIPLVIRSFGSSAYPDAITGSFPPSTRLDGFLNEIVVYNEYDAEDGTCKNGQPGGFGTIGSVGLTDPDALLFARHAILGPSLPEGYDGGNPSIVIAMNAGGTPGQFIIDTTCVNPCNHLTFVTPSCTAGSGVSFVSGTITVESNQCPENTTGLSALPAMVDVPASKVLTANDPEGDPVTFAKVAGPGSVTTTNPSIGTGMWQYTPTINDCPGFDVTFEPTDRVTGCCPAYTFHVNLTACVALNCTGSTTDPYLLACPRGDSPFKVHLVDNFGDPLAGYCDVQLDFSDCAPGEFIPQPGVYPDWPIVHASNPSDANGIMTFNIATAGNCADCNVTITVGCGFSATIPARSADVNGDLIVTSLDYDTTLGLCIDLNGNGIVNDVDLNHHLNHCCDHGFAGGPEEWLTQTIETDPDGAFVPGENVDVNWQIYNTSPGGSCPGAKASPQTSWIIDSVQMFWSDWSATPVLNYITTLIRNVPLPSGGTDQASFSHLAPQNDICYHSHVFSDCCLDPLAYRHCPPLEPDQCPPAELCVEWRIYNLALADIVVPTNGVPDHSPAWAWTLDTLTVGNLTTVTICTSELSPAGTQGTFAYNYLLNGEWHLFRCLVRQELFMGDMNDNVNSGHPNCFVDALDLGYLIDYLFSGGPAPTPALAADIDCDSFPTALDLAMIIDYLFAGSDPPPYCDRK